MSAANVMKALQASERLKTARNVLFNKTMAEKKAHNEAVLRKIKNPSRASVNDNIGYKTALQESSNAKLAVDAAEKASNAATKKLENSKTRLGGKRRTHRKRNHKRKCTRRH